MAGQGGPASKASKSSAPAVPKVPQSDVYHTLSHLHQRAAYHSALSVLSTREDDAANEGQGQTAETSASGAAAATARSSVRAARTLAAKATIRLDVGLKRTSCKGCSTPLLPGLTSQVRIHPSGPHARVARTECLTCGHARKIPTPPLLGKASASLLRSDVDLRKGSKGKRIQAQKADVIMAESNEATAVVSDTAASDAVQDVPMEEAPTKHVVPKRTTQRARRKAARLKTLASTSAPSNVPAPARRPSRTDRLLKRRLRSFVARGSTLVAPSTPLTARLSKPPRRAKLQQTREAAAPALPPFFERTQGSGWDKALPSAPVPGLERGEESGEMKVAKAIRAMRGNHLVAKGLGQGGASEQIE